MSVPANKQEVATVFDPTLVRSKVHPWEAIPRDTDANLRFRGEMFAWLRGEGEDAERRLLDWCRDDVFFWFDALMWTVDPRRHPGSPMRPWITLPFQREKLILAIEDSWGDPWSRPSDEDARVGYDLVIKKTRDIGASVAVMGCAGRRLVCFPGTLGVFVSIAEDLVDTYEGKSWPEGAENPNTLFGKLDVTTKRLPRFMREDIERSPSWYSKRSTGGILEGMGTTDNTGRSGRPTFAVYDEFSAWTMNKSKGVLQAGPSTTCGRTFISTCHGLDNGFYLMATNPDIPRIEIAWTDHPWHSAGMYRVESDGKIALVDADFWSSRTMGWLRRKFPQLVKAERNRSRYQGAPDGELLRNVYQFHTKIEPPVGIWNGVDRSPYFDQEVLRYPSKWMWAQELCCDFVGSGNPFFDASELTAYIRKFGAPPLHRGELYQDGLTYEPLAYRDVPTGGFLLWFNPAIVAGKAAPSQAFTYQIGADVSGGTGASFSSAGVWNCNTAEKIVRYRRNDLRPSRWAEVVYGLSCWFHGCPIMFEGGGIGTDFAGRLLELKANVYWMRDQDGTRKKAPGLHFNGDMKRGMLERYATALFRGQLVNHDIDALTEGFHFQTGGDGLVEHSAAVNSPDAGGSKANHGDDFMADVLAYCAMAERGFGRTEKVVRRVVESDPFVRYNREQRERRYAAMHW